jgi:hypothetical protein
MGIVIPPCCAEAGEKAVAVSAAAEARRRSFIVESTK